jgi:hypothetical protein
MHRKLSLFVIATVLVARSITWAEIANKPPASLAKAKVIVIGKIKGTYKETTRSAGWEDTRGLVEIEVEKVERAEGLRTGDTIFARFWNRTWIKNYDPPSYGSGHGLHVNGTTVRAHLEHGKGAYDILLPNGLVALEKSTNQSRKQVCLQPWVEIENSCRAEKILQRSQNTE